MRKYIRIGYATAWMQKIQSNVYIPLEEKFPEYESILDKLRIIADPLEILDKSITGLEKLLKLAQCENRDALSEIIEFSQKKENHTQIFIK